jgi:hypothetical protein
VLARHFEQLVQHEPLGLEALGLEALGERMTSSSAWIEPGMRTAWRYRWAARRAVQTLAGEQPPRRPIWAIDAGTDLDPHHGAVGTDEDDVDAPWIDRDALLEAMAMQAPELRWRGSTGSRS